MFVFLCDFLVGGRAFSFPFLVGFLGRFRVGLIDEDWLVSIVCSEVGGSGLVWGGLEMSSGEESSGSVCMIFGEG